MLHASALPMLPLLPAGGDEEVDASRRFVAAASSARDEAVRAARGGAAATVARSATVSSYACANKSNDGSAYSWPPYSMLVVHNSVCVFPQGGACRIVKVGPRHAS